jgi:hypothetical protein
MFLHLFAEDQTAACDRPPFFGTLMCSEGRIRMVAGGTDELSMWLH